jgi:hypothetical protein
MKTDLLDFSGTTKLLNDEEERSCPQLLLHNQLSSRYQKSSANPIYASENTDKLKYY